MHLESVGSVFEIIGFRQLDVRKLARLADGDKTSAQSLGQSGPEQKTPGFSSCDSGDALGFEGASQCIEGVGQSVLVPQEGGDVLEDNPRFWEVGNIADERLQVQV